MTNLSDFPEDFDYNIYRCYYDLSMLDNESLKIHYKSYGKNEGRLYKLPLNFNIKKYKKFNHDLKKLNDNELIIHYVNHGCIEKRKYSKKINNNISSSELVIVIARYNEDISDFLPYSDNLMIYNKGINDINNNIKKSHIKIVPNLGREAGTYVNFILDNYDNLPNYILFTQANPVNHISPYNKEEVFKIIDTIINEEKTYKFKYISTNKELFNLDNIVNINSGIPLTPIELGEPKDLNELINNIEHWVSVICQYESEKSNELINALKNSGKSSIMHWEYNKIFMKTKWYIDSEQAKKIFYETTKNNFDYSKIKCFIDKHEGYYLSYGSIFIVHKDNILRYSRYYWKRLFDSLQELLPLSANGCEKLWGFLLE